MSSQDRRGVALVAMPRRLQLSTGKQ